MLGKICLGTAALAACVGMLATSGCDGPSCEETATCPEIGPAGTGAGSSSGGGGGGLPTDLNLGEACLEDGQCQSMVCSGGTCCSAECGECEACDTTGECSLVAEGESAPECGAATCDGQGSCNFLAPKWTKSFGTSGADLLARVGTSGAGITVAGVFRGEEAVSLGGPSVQRAISTVRYDEQGGHTWTHQMNAGSIAGAMVASVRDLEVGLNDGVVLTGRYSGVLNVTPSELYAENEASYVVSLAGSGLVNWAISVNADLDAVALGAEGRVFASGTVAGMQDLGPDLGTTVYSVDPVDPFLVEINRQAGTLVKASDPLPIPGTSTDVFLDANASRLLLGSGPAIVSLDPEFDVEWQVEMSTGTILDVEVLPDGSAMAVGAFSDALTVGDFQFGPRGSGDLVLIRIGASGVVDGASHFGSLMAVSSVGLAVSGEGLPIVAMSVIDDVFIGDELISTSAGNVIVRFDADGGGLYAEPLVAGSGSTITDVAAGVDGGVVATGFFDEPITFGDASLTNDGGGQDAMLGAFGF